jgi:hypothetical protein
MREAFAIFRNLFENFRDSTYLDTSCWVISFRCREIIHLLKKLTNSTCKKVLFPTGKPKLDIG